MSSNKRKIIEEYHDPDYCQVDSKKSKASDTDTDRSEKIKAIVKREFLKEINAKEQEISMIDHRLTQTKRLLQRVRYAVVMNYYTKKNLEYSGNELRNDNSAGDGIGVNAGQQSAIHPSLKKLLGKKPIDYEEILKSRPPRIAAKTARNTLIKLKKNKKGTATDVTINEMVRETITKFRNCFEIPISLFDRKFHVTFPQRNCMFQSRRSIRLGVAIIPVI